MFKNIYIDNDTFGLKQILYTNGYNIIQKPSKESITIYCGDNPPTYKSHIWIKNSQQPIYDEVKYISIFLKTTKFIVLLDIKDNIHSNYGAIISGNGIHIFKTQYELFCYLPTIIDSIYE